MLLTPLIVAVLRVGNQCSAFEINAKIETFQKKLAGQVLHFPCDVHRFLGFARSCNLVVSNGRTRCASGYFTPSECRSCSMALSKDGRPCLVTAEQLNMVGGVSNQPAMLS